YPHLVHAIFFGNSDKIDLLYSKFSLSLKFQLFSLSVQMEYTFQTVLNIYKNHWHLLRQGSPFCIILLDYHEIHLTIYLFPLPHFRNHLSISYYFLKTELVTKLQTSKGKMVEHFLSFYVTLNIV